MLKIGLSQQSITPLHVEKGVSLAGMRVEKNRTAHEKLDDLYIKVAWIKKEKDLIIINGDLLYFSEQLCCQIWDWIWHNFSIDKKYVILNATHSHSCPNPSGDFLDGSFEDLSYQQLLSEKIKLAIEEAFGDLRKSKIYVSKAKCKIGINRRKSIFRAQNLRKSYFKKVIANRPNPNGCVDDDLYVLKILREDDIGAFFINYSCHPSTLTGPFLSADFPGRLAKSLTKWFGNNVKVFFLQGFAGNIRPNILSPFSSIFSSPKTFLIEIIEGRHFEKNTTENHVNILGSALADTIKSIKKDKYDEIDLSINSKVSKVNIPLQRFPPNTYFSNLFPETEADKIWQDYVLKNYNKLKSIPFRISRVDLNEKHSFLCMPGEIFCEYSLKFKEMFSPRIIIPLGYTNGMVGYIPTQQAVREGGYEVERAYKLFGLPCPISEKIEDVIIKAVKTLYET